MVIQSRANPVPLLLTRPASQAVVFADQLRQRFGDQLRLIFTPLMAPRFDVPALPAGPFGALILTSQTGVAAFARLDAAALGLPKDVFCVGEQTARAARRAGLNTIGVSHDSLALIDLIKASRPADKLLHLRGNHTRGDITQTLVFAGIDTADAVTYTQEKQALTSDAEDCLKTTAPVLVPLFSPRTAKLFVDEMARVAGISPLFFAAMSGDVAREVESLGAKVRVAIRPDAAAMSDAVAGLLMDAQRA